MLNWLSMYTRSPGPPSGRNTVGTRRTRATRLAHKQGHHEGRHGSRIPSQFSTEQRHSEDPSKKHSFDGPDGICEAREKMTAVD